MINNLTPAKKELVYTLRRLTGIGLVQGRKCLEFNGWNLELAKKNYKQYQFKGKL